MPILKPKGGHGSVGGIALYLTKKNRALASDFINCEKRDKDGIFWDEQMDETRERCGNDTDWGVKKCRSYEHLVISPDPIDNVSLEDLREFTMKWVERHFGDYQCAIVYHDDNKNDIPHAHVVINNTNLASGKRLAPQLKKKFMEEINADLQTQARARGWHHFTPMGEAIKDFDEHEGKELLSNGDNRGNYKREDNPRLTAYVAKRVQDSGRCSWREDLRNRVQTAYYLANTEKEFLDLCRHEFNVRVELSQNKKGPIDFIFYHPDKDTYNVRGGNLDKETNLFTKNHINTHFTVRGLEGLTQGERRYKANTLNKLKELKNTTPGYAGYIRKNSNITLDDVARVAAFNRLYKIQSLDDYDSAALLNPKLDKRLVATIKMQAHELGLFKTIKKEDWSKHVAGPVKQRRAKGAGASGAVDIVATLEQEAAAKRAAGTAKRKKKRVGGGTTQETTTADQPVTQQQTKQGQQR